MVIRGSLIIGNLDHKLAMSVRRKIRVPGVAGRSAPRHIGDSFEEVRLSGTIWPAKRVDFRRKAYIRTFVTAEG